MENGFCQALKSCSDLASTQDPSSTRLSFLLFSVACEESLNLFRTLGFFLYKVSTIKKPFSVQVLILKSLAMFLEKSSTSFCK